jgi:hypothetical protein
MNQPSGERPPRIEKFRALPGEPLPDFAERMARECRTKTISVTFGGKTSMCNVGESAEEIERHFLDLFEQS